MAWFGHVLLCERHIKEAEAREQREHWEEVNLYLDLWDKVAHARENTTLSRLLRYARLEAQTDKEFARESIEKAVKSGRRE